MQYYSFSKKEEMTMKKILRSLTGTKKAKSLSEFDGDFLYEDVYI